MLENTITEDPITENLISATKFVVRHLSNVSYYLGLGGVFIEVPSFKELKQESHYSMLKRKKESANNYGLGRPNGW